MQAILSQFSQNVKAKAVRETDKDLTVLDDPENVKEEDDVDEAQEVADQDEIDEEDECPERSVTDADIKAVCMVVQKVHVLPVD